MDEAYIGGPFPDFTSICHYAGCLKMSITIIPCPKCSLVSIYVYDLVYDIYVYIYQ